MTHRDAYPLLRVEELLDALGHAWVLFYLDLTVGYFQVVVAEHDQEKMSVVTPCGNAPATFQCLMEVTLSDMAFEVLLVYFHTENLVFLKD